MNRRIFNVRAFSAAAIALAVWITPIISVAQTTIVAPKNKYKVQDDIKLGNQAAAEAERTFPVLSNADAQIYVQRIGERLVANIPAQFQHPEFTYRFKVINASDLNAFALPGGPMYVNRGMIEKARNEGELAGVMAHELSHVALRHSTAQATKQSSAGSILGQLGLILGGAILGGESGAQLGALGAAAWMTKFSREYETQADTLGAQIMANAGYDPRDLANVFKTIQSEGGSNGPAWLSDHPDPGNRYENINHLAETLRIGQAPPRYSPGLERVQYELRQLPPARTMAQLEEAAKNGNPAGNGSNGNGYPSSNGRYSTNVQYPSSRVRSYTGLSWLQIKVPSNWQDFTSGDSVTFAPNGAYGDQGITRGAMVGVYNGGNRSLQSNTQAYVNDIIQGNSYLRQQSYLSTTTLAGRSGYTAMLSGRSPITGQTELVTIYTTQLRSGETFYVATVVPQSESESYYYSFRNLLNSIRLSDY
ncbi:MAG: M48 family metalloprotease [Acidobacteria bacterium]|nr:M48 family metalloprotease [Acidobacteriota bacterium]